MHHLKKILVSSLYLVVATSAVLVIIELALATAHRVTNDDRLSTFQGIGVKPDRPDVPEEYVKVGIFGGSSARGFGSKANFGQILGEELARRYPDLNF